MPRLFTPTLQIVVLLIGSLSSSFGAEAFPKPEPEKAFPEFKIYDSAGRPWRLAQEDWEGARRRVREDAAWTAWLARERAEADRWMAKHRDRVEWAAGWSHDGVSPKDGSRLSWNEQIPGEEAQFFSSRTDPRVEITPKLFAWWVVTFRVRHTEMMQRAAALYRLTGDERYAAWAAEQLDFYADNYLKWQPARDGARLFWQTLTEATGLIRLVETARNLSSYVAPARKRHWGEQLFFPEVAVLNASYRNVHNIACWQRGAAAQVALLYDDEAMWREAIDGRWGIRTQLAKGVTSDYLWHEQSLGYNGYVVRALYSTFIAAALHDRAADLAREMAIAQNLLVAPTYYRFPTGQLPNPADNTGLIFAPSPEGFAGVYRVFPTTLGLAAVADRRDWDTLLDPPPPAPAGILAEASTRGGRGDAAVADASSEDRPGRGPRGRFSLARIQAPLPPIVSRNLETSRMAILKSGAWQVFFHYGQLTRSHTESEALNYSAFYGDTDITHDAGTMPYGSPLHLGYFTRGLAHNAPLVNGEGQHLGPFGERREWIVEEPNPMRPMRGELLEFSTTPARVTAAQPEYRPEARARRTLTVEGNALVDRATIESTAAEPQKLGLALHLQGKVQLPEAFQSDRDFAANRSEPFGFWKEARRAVYRDKAEFKVDYGAVSLRVTITLPGEFHLWHAMTPDVSPRTRESFYLETIGTQATFTTKFEPME